MFEDSKPPRAAKRVKMQYSAKEKTDYEAKEARERKVKKEGSVAWKGKVKQRLWAEADQGVNPNVVNKLKQDTQWTRC